MPAESVTAEPIEQNPLRWFALAVLTLPVLIISMDATILGLAIPHLSRSLAPSSSELLWIIDMYSFVLAGLLVTMGVLGDRIGRRRVLLWGAAAFSAASVFAAFSTSPTMLIAARAALGIAGATLMPSTLSLLRNVFIDTAERQLAIAVWAASFALGAAIGPIVGGALLEHFWWGSVFLVGVPVTGILLFIAPKVLPESRDPNPGPFDFISSLLSMLTMLPLVYAMKSVAESGVTSEGVISALIGGVALTLFLRRQNRLRVPMIDVSLFGVSAFRKAVLGNLIACFGFAGSMFIVTQVIQLVFGVSAMRAGLYLMPAALTSVMLSLSAPYVSRRIGAFRVVAVGLIGGGIGFAVVGSVDASSPVWQVVIGLMIINGGLGASMTVAIDGIIAAIPPERAGAGASVSETANELGIALGTAVLGSIVTAVYRPRIDELSGFNSGVIERARETLAGAIAAAEGLGTTTGEQLQSTAIDAFMAGSRVAALAAAGALLVIGLWVLATPRAAAGSSMVAQPE